MRQLIVSKKSLAVAIVHFVTAFVSALAVVCILWGLYFGGIANFEGEGTEGVGHAFAMLIVIPIVLIASAGLLVSVLTFIFSGVKLISQAHGQLPSKKSFIFTLVMKTIVFAIVLLSTILSFEFAKWEMVVSVQIVALALSLISSLLEAYVRRKP